MAEKNDDGYSIHMHMIIFGGMRSPSFIFLKHKTIHIAATNACMQHN